MLEEIPATSRGRTYLSEPGETDKSSSTAVPGGSSTPPQPNIPDVAISMKLVEIR